MTREEAIRALLHTATRFDGVLEDPPNSNRGVQVDFLNWWTIGDWRAYPMGGKGAPYCAGFVQVVGRLAIGVLWPVPRESDVDKLVEWAMAEGVAATQPEPHHAEVGDLLTIWYPNRNEFGHVAIITGAIQADGRCATIEGNTNAEGSREGNGVHRRRRQVRRKDVLIRWANLL